MKNAPATRKWNNTKRANNNKTRKMNNGSAKPRKGKMMRECRSNVTGCERHMANNSCKFVHRNNVEWKMLRNNQKVSKNNS
jgi:hypothetical protein